MAKATKIWLAVAISLVLIGCIILGGTMGILNWDFSKLTTAKVVTNTYEIDQVFEDISITTDTAEIIFAPSDNEKASVICCEYENAKHSVVSENGALTVTLVDTRKWYNHIGIFSQSPQITVLLPQAQYGALTLHSDTGAITIPKDFHFDNIDITEHTGKVTNYASATGHIQIQTDTGAICIADVTADAIELSVSTGGIEVANVQCQSFCSTGDTGDAQLTNVIATHKLSAETSTGHIRLDRCDAGALFLKADTGNITGSLLSDKVFIAHSDTGRVDVPKTTSGGKCEVSTDTGNIKISIA